MDQQPTPQRESYLIKAQVEIESESRSVWRALTDAAELERWFAERAKADLGGGVYTFCGRHTPDTPCTEQELVSLRDYEAGRRLAYNWEIRGAATVVEYELAGRDGGSALTVTHSGVPSLNGGRVSYKDWWLLVLANLRNHVTAGRAPLRWDLEREPGFETVLSIDVEVPVARVYEVLTTPQHMERFMQGEGARADLRVGGDYRFGWGESEGPMKILELKPRERLKTDWFHADDPPSVLTWELADSGGRTRLTLTHGGFAEFEDQELGKRRADEYGSGWIRFLHEFRELAERPDGEGVPVLLEAPEGWLC